MGEGEGGMIWENGIETCIISYKKRTASPGLIQDTGCLVKRISDLPLRKISSRQLNLPGKLLGAPHGLVKGRGDFLFIWG